MDDRNLGAQIALGFIALCGFLAAHLLAQINAQILDHEIRIRAAEFAIAGRSYSNPNPEETK